MIVSLSTTQKSTPLYGSKSWYWLSGLSTLCFKNLAEFAMLCWLLKHRPLVASSPAKSGPQIEKGCDLPSCLHVTQFETPPHMEGLKKKETPLSMRLCAPSADGSADRGVRARARERPEALARFCRRRSRRLKRWICRCSSTCASARCGGPGSALASGCVGQPGHPHQTPQNASKGYWQAPVL